MKDLKPGHYCWYINELEVSEDGKYIPCIVIEGENGYHLTDYKWSKDIEVARKSASIKNDILGLSQDDVNRIVSSTMCKKRRKEATE